MSPHGQACCFSGLLGKTKLFVRLDDGDEAPVPKPSGGSIWTKEAVPFSVGKQPSLDEEEPRGRVVAKAAQTRSSC